MGIDIKIYHSILAFIRGSQLKTYTKHIMVIVVSCWDRSCCSLSIFLTLFSFWGVRWIMISIPLEVRHNCVIWDRFKVKIFQSWCVITCALFSFCGKPWHLVLSYIVRWWKLCYFGCLQVHPANPHGTWIINNKDMLSLEGNETLRYSLLHHNLVSTNYPWLAISK